MHTPDAAGGRRARGLAAWAVLAAVAAVLLYPALRPAHVEGFSASIVSLGLHIAGGDVTAYDRVFPTNLEFFGLSRLGATLAVALLTGVFGVDGEWAMRLVMWAGLVLLAGASWVLVRRWSNAGGLVAAAALLVLPGAADSAFFYNDNVLSAALAAAAFAVLGTSRRTDVAALAGALFGGGVITRADAVLLGAAVPLLLLAEHSTAGAPVWQALRSRALWTRGLAFAAGALVPLVALPGAFHATLFDVLAISTHVMRLWGRGAWLSRHVEQAVLFVGIPGALLMAIGLYRLARGREVARLLLLAGVPLLYNLAFLGKVWQARQLLPLTPFLAALVAAGWQQLAAPAGSGGRATSRWPALARAAVVALVAAVWLAPAGWMRSVDDGPRALRGRVWLQGSWTAWQDAVTADLASVQRFTTGAAAARPAVILTDGWNSDRYLHLALQEAGYTLAPAGQIAPACARTAELFERGGRRVLHVRLHTPFLPSAEELTPERLDTYGVPCLTAARPSSAYLLATTARVRRLFRRDPPSALGLTRAGADSTLLRTGYDPHTAVRLDSATFAELRARYAAVAAAPPAVAYDPQLDVSLAESERLLGSHVPLGPPNDP